MKNLLVKNNNPVSFSDSANLDAFSRLRVSQLTAHCDLKQLHDGLPLFIDKVTNGTATANYNTNQSSTTLATSADGDYD